MHQVADAVEPCRVPGIGLDEVGDIGERHAGTRVGPAIGAADPAMAVSYRRGDAAETADATAGATRMRTEAAMHRDPCHPLVGAIAGEVAGDVFDHAMRKQAHRAEPPA